MSELDDLKDFVDVVEEHMKEVQVMATRNSAPTTQEGKADSFYNSGTYTQYALYGNGYAPTTQTIPTLPPGCYEIDVTPKAIYAVPMLESTNLLLDLPEMKSNEVIAKVDSFWNSEKDYKEGNEFVVGGAAFKAGIMIYGPPGSGKSCTIKLVAKKLVEAGGTVFYASLHPNPINTFLTDFATIEKDRKCIVVLEDIDSLISHHGEAGYLAMLDSAQSIDNVLFIATTNYPERLDPRIYNRPGRFSHVIKIGLPTAACREAYLKAILKNHKDIEYIVANTNGFTIDHLTALINATYREKKDLSNEIERLRVLYKVPKSDDKAPIGIGRE